MATGGLKLETMTLAGAESASQLNIATRRVQRLLTLTIYSIARP